MSHPVLLAPVPAETLASALAVPRLRQEVAFGTRQRGLPLATGALVFIHVSLGHAGSHGLHQPGHVTWRGRLGRLTPAAAVGSRRGMHPDGRMRPPFADAYDYKDARIFWHVLGLEPLAEPIPFDCFRDAGGARLFGGLAAQWITVAWLREGTVRAAPRENSPGERVPFSRSVVRRTGRGQTAPKPRP